MDSYALNVKLGQTKERTIKVSSNQTTSFLLEGENVLSTPSMIAEMEETCRLLLKEQVIPDKDWDSVGTIVDIKHLAATPVGARCLMSTIVPTESQSLSGITCSLRRSLQVSSISAIIEGVD